MPSDLIMSKGVSIQLIWLFSSPSCVLRFSWHSPLDACLALSTSRCLVPAYRQVWQHKKCNLAGRPLGGQSMYTL